jgi:hypothetical protein
MIVLAAHQWMFTGLLKDSAEFREYATLVLI